MIYHIFKGNNFCSVVAEMKGILPTNKKSTSQLKLKK
jgi:hypothetical protein